MRGLGKSVEELEPPDKIFKLLIGAGRSEKQPDFTHASVQALALGENRAATPAGEHVRGRSFGSGPRVLVNGPLAKLTAAFEATFHRKPFSRLGRVLCSAVNYNIF